MSTSHLFFLAFALALGWFPSFLLGSAKIPNGFVILYLGLILVLFLGTLLTLEN